MVNEHRERAMSLTGTRVKLERQVEDPKCRYFSLESLMCYLLTPGRLACLLSYNSAI